MSRKTDEIIYGMFHDILKASGIVLNPQQGEMLRAKSEKLANQFESMIRVISVSVAEQLQKATLIAFEKTDKKFTEIGERVDTLPTESDVLEQFNILNKRVLILEEKVMREEARKDDSTRSRRDQRAPNYSVSKDSTSRE